MISLLGTSHISKESKRKINKSLDGIDIICVELDPIRYHSLLKGDRTAPKGLFMKLLFYIQGYMGKHTGMMPGEDMLYATKEAIRNKVPCYLIDADIRQTAAKLTAIPIIEKIRLFLPSMSKIDIRKIPNEDIILKSIEMLKRRSPTAYKVLVAERDRIMSKRVIEVSEKYENILVVVGAGHVSGMERILKRNGKTVKRI